MNIKFVSRKRNAAVYGAALQYGLSELPAHLLACRAKSEPENLDQIIEPSLKYINRPTLLKDADTAADRIVQAVLEGERIGILTDYDVDGVCSHAVLLDALTRYFGVDSSKVKSYIGHRLEDGYGVSEGLTDKILAESTLPDLIITADCGSSDEQQISRLNKAGINVIITDHHAIPKEGVPPSAYATVNPLRKECDYPDKSIAGCTVSWLLMCHVRNKLVDTGYLPATTPKLLASLDWVGLATVADAVSLFSATNRAVVNAGLTLMNRLARPCWRAVFTMLGRTNQPFTSQDLGFQIGPRINARSRMADPYAALRFILSESQRSADLCLSALDHNNRERKQTEQEMIRIAKQQAARSLHPQQTTIVTADQRFHAGVQGIVASRLVEAFGRPAVVFSNAPDPNHLTGSARTIEEVHIRRALQFVADHNAGIFVSFGGHHGAAGLTIFREKLEIFKLAFEEAVRSQVGQTELSPVIWTDGPLDESQITLETLNEIKRLEPFGREFEEPVFEGCFVINTLRRVGAEPIHLSMQLVAKGQTFKAIWFRAIEAGGDPLPIKVGDAVKCAYRLNQNEFRGVKSLQLIIIHALPVKS